MKKDSNVSVSLALKPKSYVVSVDYKYSWPAIERVDYHYHDLVQALRHVRWLARQMLGQNGEEAQRRNVVLGFALSEYLRSKKRDKKLPPIDQFTAPKGRERPWTGGVTFLRDLGKKNK